MNMAAGPAELQAGGARAVRSDAWDLDFLYEHFHKDSPDVEPDKSTKKQYKRKRCFVAGKWRSLTCTKKILTSSVEDAVKHCMESPAYRNSGIQLHPKSV